MLKFYYSGAPNPTKVALLLEETGLPYEADPGRHPQGRPAQAGIPGDQSERQGAGDRRRRRHRVRFQRDPALSRREDRQIPAGQERQGARRTAVVDDVRRLRRRAVFRPVGAFPQLRAGEERTTPSTATCSRRSATTASSTRGSPSRNTCSATPTPSSTWTSGAGRGCMPNVLGEGAWDEIPEPQAAGRRDQRAAGGAARERAQGQAQVQDRDGRRGAQGHVPAHET